MRFVVACLIMSTSLPAVETMTNGDIIKMVEAGFSAATIEAKVRSTKGVYDTSADALIALKAAGVPESVLRLMIEVHSRDAKSPRAASTVNATPAPPNPRPATRRFEVSVHRQGRGRCDDAELRVDDHSIRSSRCRDLDFNVKWSEMIAVCHDYGFRGVVRIRTAAAEHVISTTHPAQAKEIVSAIEKRRSSRTASCR